VVYIERKDEKCRAQRIDGIETVSLVIKDDGLGWFD